MTTIKRPTTCRRVADGNVCTYKGCTYAHTVSELLMGDCKYGDDCYMDQCKFYHPYDKDVKGYCTRLNKVVPPDDDEYASRLFKPDQKEKWPKLKVTGNAFQQAHTIEPCPSVWGIEKPQLVRQQGFQDTMNLLLRSLVISQELNSQLKERLAVRGKLCVTMNIDPNFIQAIADFGSIRNRCEFSDQVCHVEIILHNNDDLDTLKQIGTIVSVVEIIQLETQ